MTPENRHPNSSSGYFYRLVTHDLASLIDHFHLFLCVAVFKKFINMRQHVERYLVRIDITLNLSEVEQVCGLLEKFIHGLLPGSRDRLKGSHNHPLYFCRIVYRLQGDDHLDRRTVWVGYDAFMP